MALAGDGCTTHRTATKPSLSITCQRGNARGSARKWFANGRGGFRKEEPFWTLCGDGVPVAEVLIESGFEVYGVDASATMVASFRNSFPGARVEHASVEDSTFFGRSFDGVVAWGLLFLLTRDAQECLINKIASALITGGQFLFTSPSPACTWLDAMTGRESFSPGREEYRRVLQNAGLTLIEERQDEGENHYYFASKP